MVSTAWCGDQEQWFQSLVHLGLNPMDGYHPKYGRELSLRQWSLVGWEMGWVNNTGSFLRVYVLLPPYSQPYIIQTI